MTLRKHTVFEPCQHHESWYASESRSRRAEVMAEGGWAGSPCPGPQRCRMKPGTDFYTPEFVAEYPNYYVMPEAIAIGRTYTFYCEVQQEYEPPENRLRRFTGTAVTVLSKDTDRDDAAGDGYIVRAEDGTEFTVQVDEINGWDYEQSQFFWPDGRYGRDRSDRFLGNERVP